MDPITETLDVISADVIHVSVNLEQKERWDNRQGTSLSVPSGWLMAAMSHYINSDTSFHYDASPTFLIIFLSFFKHDFIWFYCQFFGIF